MQLLEAFALPHASTNCNDSKSNDESSIGIGLDCCVVPLKRHKDMFLIQTTDFFYPLVDDPYTMGWIACANTLSDMYAMGAVDCDNMLMLLAAPTDDVLPMEHRRIVLTAMMRGFAECASSAGTLVRGGQTVFNPWLLVGGVATAVCSRDEFTMPNDARPGQVLVLTKPLGTQVAVNAYQQRNTAEWAKRLKREQPDDERIEMMYYRAVDCMKRLNRRAAEVMRECGASACTDVTGFGLLGHADNLARAQRRRLTFVVDSLPVLRHAVEFARCFGPNAFGLLRGTSAETSGGLLIALDGDAAATLCARLGECGGPGAHIVGTVAECGDGDEPGATLVPNANVVQVPDRALPAGTLW